MLIPTDAGPRNSRRQRAAFGLLSVAMLVAAYTLISNAYRFLEYSVLPEALGRVLRPDVLPPTQRLLDAFLQLIGGQAYEVHEGAHASDHLGLLLQQHVSLQGSLLVSAARVLAGLCIGAPLGILAGLAMGWSKTIDEYVHPIYIFLRSIPPLALITYLMLWFGHGEAHLLVPIVYAVLMTIAIPTYHGVKDIPDTYISAARTLGVRGRLLFLRIVLPAASPVVLSGLRHSLIIAWMTAVGVEMLMAENGIGHLLVGGGIWSSRFEVGVDPAVVMVGILGLAAAGFAMDTAARVTNERLTHWMR